MQQEKVKMNKAQELVKEYLVEKKWYTPFIQTDVPIRFNTGQYHKLSLVAYRLIIEINGENNEQVRMYCEQYFPYSRFVMLEEDKVLGPDNKQYLEKQLGF